MTNRTPFYEHRAGLIQELLETEPIHTGSWQRIDTSSSPAHATYELTDVPFRMHVPRGRQALQDMLQPDLPWAETHFQERVGGEPLNPPPSHEIWPHAVRGNGQHLDGGKFSHTYPERFWARYTGGHDITGLEGDFIHEDGKMYRMVNGQRYGSPIDVSRFPRVERQGVRFRYGDFADVVELLKREPLTRQAYLPIWFPEDTGVHAGQRVPCTLGYHFLVREGWLTCRYFMRSCDIYRHFTNDVYMAARLMQEVCQMVNLGTEHELLPAQLIMYITSLHGFVGDREKLEAML